MAYSFDDPTVPERHDLQYFEMFVNRGIYHQGWTACTRHSTPWVVAPLPPIDDDVWELYGPDDWTQARNIANQNPAKLAELQRLFLIEASKYNVLPLDDRRVERFNADLAGRPQLVTGATQLLFGGMGRLSENSVLVIKNKSHAITANITVPDRGAEGVIISQGGAFAGWSLYAKDGKPKYCYNTLGLMSSTVEGDRALTPGDHQVRMEFAYDGGGLGKGGNVTLYVDGDKVGEGRVEATVPMVFSADETTDVGHDTGTGVSSRLRHRRQRVHRSHPLGPDRHRRQGRGPRPPHHTGGTLSHRDGAPIAAGPVDRPCRVGDHPRWAALVAGRLSIHGAESPWDFQVETAHPGRMNGLMMTDVSLDELGPVDFVVVEFPAGASNFTGEMAAELVRLVDSGLIRVIDVLILTKNDDGVVEAMELSDVGALGELQAIEAQLAELLAEEDVEHLAAGHGAGKHCRGAHLGEGITSNTGKGRPKRDESSQNARRAPVLLSVDRRLGADSQPTR